MLPNDNNFDIQRVLFLIMMLDASKRQLLLIFLIIYNF